ncbi:MAG TPA: serine acetyltransferase [Gammaproteobacteria bacterium]|nr:serine acetyltransferase [Gammaproteobacteria bacterium]
MGKRFDEIRRIYHRHESSILNPALWAVLNYRYGAWARCVPNRFLRYFLMKLYGLNAFLILITSGIRLNCEARIGRDLHLVHSGNISVHPGAIIGDRCGIQQDVTIGTNPDRKGTPVIGNDVYIGAGAKILGPVTIGDRSRIAANSLVIGDVPEDATAIGVPARVIRYGGGNRAKTDHEKSSGKSADQPSTQEIVSTENQVSSRQQHE